MLHQGNVGYQTVCYSTESSLSSFLNYTCLLCKFAPRNSQLSRWRVVTKWEFYVKFTMYKCHTNISLSINFTFYNTPTLLWAPRAPCAYYWKCVVVKFEYNLPNPVTPCFAIKCCQTRTGPYYIVTKLPNVIPHKEPCTSANAIRKIASCIT